MIDATGLRILPGDLSVLLKRLFWGSCQVCSPKLGSPTDLDLGSGVGRRVWHVGHVGPVQFAR